MSPNNHTWSNGLLWPFSCVANNRKHVTTSLVFVWRKIIIWQSWQTLCL